MAMRRFNQAWLLDSNNAEVYAGFAAVLHDQGKNCEAMKMMEDALSRNPPSYQGIYPDAGRIIALCAVSDNSISEEAKAPI
jgi:Tfp pilus assembly protein PilF